MKSIQERFKLKGGKYGPPMSYLGAQLSKMTNANGTECWTLSSHKYIEESVKTVQEFLRSKNRALPKGGKNLIFSKLKLRFKVQT
jgi:hypothetical protein